MPARKNRPGKCGTTSIDLDPPMTPEERLLMAIFGPDDGNSWEETVRRMRREQKEADRGCGCTTLCEMGPTCPGGMAAGLPHSGCYRTTLPGERSSAGEFDA